MVKFSTKSEYIGGHVGSYVGGKSRFRILHNVADGLPVDGFLDTRSVFRNFPYKSISDYIELTSGIHDLSIKIAQSDECVTGGEITFIPDRTYTLIIHGSMLNVVPLLIEDDLRCPLPDKANIRFIHAAANIHPIDLYSGSSKIFTNISYGKLGTPIYLSIQPGSSELYITPSGSLQIILGPINLRFVEGGIYTIILSGIIGNPNTPLTALVSEDTKGSCIVMNL